MAERKLRVVVLLDSIASPGGGERLAVQSAIRLDPERFERTVCLSRWEDSFETTEPAKGLLAEMREAGVEVIGLRRDSKLSLGAWRPLVRELRDGTDVLHAHMFGSNVWAALLGRSCRVPAVIAHEHIWSYEGNSLRSLLDRHLIARRTDAFVAVSEAGRRRMIEDEGIAPGDIVYIPNGVPSKPPGDRSKLRDELGIGPDIPLVGSVGNLRAQKAFEVLIEAAALLRKEHPELRIVVAGEGPERERLEGLIAASQLGDRFRLLGNRTDVPDVLAALDIAVCCSDFEGGPLSVMEYMGASLPVVATRVDGLEELVEDGVTGLVVPPRDPGSLAGAISTLLSDTARAAALGAEGKLLRDSEYDIDRWVERLQDLYRTLVGPGTR